jgi:hypothetical protein
VDYSRFFGSMAELEALVGLTPATPTPAPPPPAPTPKPAPSAGARCEKGSPKNGCGSCHTASGVPYESACGGTSATAYCQKSPAGCLNPDALSFNATVVSAVARELSRS